MATYNNILLAVDFSDGSKEATATAARLAKSAGATLHALSVHDVPLQSAFTGLGPEASSPGGVMDVLAAIREQTQQRLDALKSELAEQGVQVQTHLAEGSPADCIVKTAAELNVDLIVLGTHGRTGVRRLLIGSVAERVVRTAVCAVMTVPLADDD